jgi:small subunit ribosomal protein S21
MQGYKRQKNNFSHYQHNDNRRPKREFEQKSQGLVVHLREGEDINRALRKLKKKIENAGLLKELRDRQYYEKPSEKRRKAKKAGVMRWKKRQRELELNR